MAKLAKFLQGVAGAAGGGGLNVEEVFSTFVADATGSGALTINNGIDLSGEGGIVWVKSRNNSHNHYIFDPNVGSGGYLIPNSNTVGLTGANYSFTSTGLTDTYNNYSNNEAVWWTFRKAPKFFDVVTYTGNGTAGRTISHNLGSVPGCIIVKNLSTGSTDWSTYHRSEGATKYGKLNTTDAFSGAFTGQWNETEPTDSVFTVGDSLFVNQNGDNYVAYLFAHNDGDGEFGPTGDQDIIKCGSYTGNSTIGHTIDLGFEAQWVLVRSTSNLRKWMLYDIMRGMPVDGIGAALYPNSSDDEEDLTRIGASNVGFQLTSTDSMVNVSGETYIYIAIRRGPMAVPESATDVFGINDRNSTGSSIDITSGFPVDWFFTKTRDNTYGFQQLSRLQGDGVRLGFYGTFAEQTDPNFEFDHNTKVVAGSDSSIGINRSGDNNIDYMFRRAPSFCDVVAYTGNGTAGRTVSHNLGVVPEMIWFKSRSNAQNWYVYHKDNTYISGALSTYLRLNTTDARLNSSYFMSSISSSDFGLTIGTPNDSGKTYIAYLFASLDGVSKVGSYTGNGTSTGDAQNIDCGFSSGARFVLIKATSVAYGWMLFDTERGITSGNDSLLLLNDTDAETTAFDSVDPYSSGFTAVQGPYNVNQNGVSYIFYAIA